jgi:hypothetical protein
MAKPNYSYEKRQKELAKKKKKEEKRLLKAAANEEKIAGPEGTETSEINDSDETTTSV